jgi:phosphotransferase system enzyme I (PtsI)
MIQMTVSAAKKNKIPVSVCGELASDATMLPLLVAFGIREFSAQPGAVPEIKEWVRMMDTRRMKKKVNAKRLATQEGVYEILKELSLEMQENESL